MILTLRFASGLILAAFAIGLSGQVSWLLPVGVGLISLLIVLAVADWLRLRGVRLEVARACDDKLSLGAHNAIHLTARNNGYFRIKGRLRDEYPEGFASENNVFRIDLLPRSETEFAYHVTPPKRGDYEFGDIYVRLNGPLGIVVRQMRFPMRRDVCVYPNILDIRRYEIGLRRQRPLQPGQRVVKVRGRGTDFESLRDYLPDDEFRVVDWKATARRGKLVAREYQEEKSQNVVVVLDCGRIMGPIIPLTSGGGQGEVNLTRLDHAINAGVMLAHVASRKGDKVGLMAFGEDITSYSPPRVGHSQVLSLLRLTYNLKEAEGDSNYSRAFSYLARRWTRRSLVVVFTDLVDPDSSKSLITQIAGLAKKHLCIVVAMDDPAVDQAATGPFTEPEDAFRAAAARQTLHARRQAGAMLSRTGAIVLDVPPEHFTPAVVDRYLDIKSRGLL